MEQPATCIDHVSVFIHKVYLSRAAVLNNITKIMIMKHSQLLKSQPAIL